MKQETKQCQNCKNEFVIEPEDFGFYEKMQVPPPTFCPDCRFQRRLAYRNERNLYKRRCDLCKELKVSDFAPDYPHKVYCSPCWWSDKWDAREYAQDYDFSKPFFEQFVKLREKVPQPGLAVGHDTMVNSEYCHMAKDLKDCYLVTHSNNDENCFYSSALNESKDSGEMLSCQECNLCLENVNCFKCHKVYFSLDCESCYNVAFSRNCIGCSDCFGCANLRNKKYHIFNQPYSKEDYFKKLQELNIGSYKIVKEVKEKIKDFWLKFPQKYIHGQHNVNVSGDYIYHSKNALNCYDVVYVEDSRYCQYLTVKPISQCYDFTEWGDNAHLVYEGINNGVGFTNSKFNQQSWENCRELEYTSHCITCSNLFGCVSLRHKQYCILNKQYSKKEYESLRKKIIEHMNEMPYVDKKGRVYRYGEFFPIELSFWGYNETTANEHFPLTKEKIEKEGYRWIDIDKNRGVYQITIKADQLSNNIKDISDSILEEIIECEGCHSPYRIVKQELDFYKNQNIALPRKCPECRYKDRFLQRNSFKLYHRKCQCSGEESDSKIYRNATSHFHGKDHCPNEFETSYAPERKEIVYCRECYQNEVI